MARVNWRKWHRWVGVVAVPFVLFVSFTGVAAGLGEALGEDEAARERLREQVSPVTLPASPAAWSGPVEKALATAAAQAPGAPVDKVAVEFKGDRPTVTVYTGRPGGGEDRKFVVDARTGELIRAEGYVDKPFLVRLHSGEAFGDAGLLIGFVSAVLLVGLTVSGVVIYLAMRRPGRGGLGRLFWVVPAAVAVWPG